MNGTTAHAKNRSRQRGIPSFLIQAVIQYGEAYRGYGGRTIYYLREKSARELFLCEWRQFSNVGVVVDKSGAIITAYRTDKAPHGKVLNQMLDTFTPHPKIPGFMTRRTGDLKTTVSTTLGFDGVGYWTVSVTRDGHTLSKVVSFVDVETLDSVVEELERSIS